MNGTVITETRARVQARCPPGAAAPWGAAAMGTGPHTVPHTVSGRMACRAPLPGRVGRHLITEHAADAGTA